MNPKTIWSKSLLFFLLFCLSGCVGAHFSYKFEAESKIIPDHTVNGKYVGQQMKKDYFYTKREVIDLLGDPEKSWSKDGYEYLSYGKGEWRFSGVVLYFVVPLPLLFPVGLKDEIVVFKNNQLEKVIRIGTKTYFSGCVFTKWEKNFHPTCFVGDKEFPKYE